MVLNFDNYEIDTGDIQVLLKAADIIVTSYSGTGGEAVAIGSKSINVHMGNRVSITPFDDFNFNTQCTLMSHLLHHVDYLNHLRPKMGCIQSLFSRDICFICYLQALCHFVLFGFTALYNNFFKRPDAIKKITQFI